VVLGPDTLRVSVVGGHDRVDLVVPAAVNVAELLPELLLRLRHGDPDPAGARLAVVGGPPLDAGAGLAAQGVPDGAVLTVVAAADRDRVHPPADDLAAVVAEVVETVPRPVPAAVGRCALGVATALLGLGALGALVLATPAAAAVSGVLGVVLLATAALVARRRGSAELSGAAGWLAVAHAGAAGALGGAVGAGVGWVVAGGAAAVVCGRRRSPLWGAAVAGVVLVAAGSVAELAPAPLPRVLTWALVAVVVTGDLHPWLAATWAGLGVPPLGEAPPAGPDGEAVAVAVRRAHDLLLVASVVTGLLLTVLGPVVAAQGAWSLALVLLCCAVVAFRSRRQRVGASGPVGLLGSAVPLLPVAVAVWAHSPEWRSAAVVGLGCCGLFALAVVALPMPRNPRAGRAAELAEALALVALPPVLLAATGLLDVVRGLVG
jgi:type VII secretion integral membrane protein EccD